MEAVREGAGGVVVVPEIDVSRLPETIGQEVTRILGAAQLAADQIRMSADREAEELLRRVERLRTGLGSILEQLQQLAEHEAPPAGGVVGPPVVGVAGAVGAVGAVGEEAWPVPSSGPAADAVGPMVAAVADAASDEDHDPEAAEIQARVSNEISVVERLRRMAT